MITAATIDLTGDLDLAFNTRHQVESTLNAARPGAPATVHINSPGGDSLDCAATYSRLRRHEGEVTCIIDGVAAGGASLIAMAGTRRIIHPAATMQVMANAAPFPDQADESTAEILAKANQTYAQVFAERAGGTVGEWLARMHADDGAGTWFTATEALAVGLATAVAEQEETTDA